MSLVKRSMGAASAALSGIVAVCVTSIAPAQDSNRGEPDFLTESYGDWVVRCEQADATGQTTDRNCEMVQQLTSASSGQVLVQLRFAPPGEDDSHVGMLTVPLGILVQQPITLRVDGEDLIEARVSSCVQIGCIAQFTVDPVDWQALRDGESLAVRLATANSREIYEAALSLQGFEAASDRLAEFAGAAN
ncbi:MAG: invasion associated locus B family protein [Pseudomonadota bacterium]